MNNKFVFSFRKEALPRISAGAVLVLSLSGVLSACSSDKEPKAGASTSSSPAASAVSTQEPVKEKLKIVWALPQYSPNASLAQADKDFVKKAIDAKFNVDFQIIQMTGAAGDWEKIVEMIEVMKAFTFNDPDGNKKNDTYGFTIHGFGGVQLNFDFPMFLRDGMQRSYWVENNQLRSSKFDANLGQYIDELVKLIDMKVVDPDWFLNKYGQDYDKASQGKVGIVTAWEKDIAFDNNANGIQFKTKQITGVQEANWQPFHPFAGKNMGIGVTPGNYNPWMLNSKSSDAHAERSIEILNWLMGEEGYLLTHYGEAGKQYKKDGNKITPDAAALAKDIVDNGNFLDMYKHIAPMEPQTIGLELIDPNATDRDREILKVLRSYPKADSVGTALSVGAGMDLPSLSKKGTEYINKMLLEEKSGANWPKYRQDLIQNFGLQTIMDHYSKQISEALGTTVTFK